MGTLALLVLPLLALSSALCFVCTPKHLGISISLDQGLLQGTVPGLRTCRCVWCAPTFLREHAINPLPLSSSSPFYYARLCVAEVCRTVRFP